MVRTTAPLVATVLALATGAPAIAQNVAASERFHLGREAFRRGDLLGAERSFREAVALDRSAIVPRLEWARTLIRLDRSDEAADALAPLEERLDELASGTGSMASLYHRLRASIYARRSDPDAAIDQFELAVGHAPFALQLRFQLIGLYRGQGDDERALSHLEAAAAQRPRSVEIRIELGRTTLALERWEDAEIAFERAIELAPGNAVAWEGLGRALSGDGRFADAEVAIRRGLAAAPASALLHERLGDVLFERAAYDDALSAYERAQALSGQATPALRSKIDRARETLSP